MLEPMTQAAPPQTPRPRARAMQIALAISVTLNLVVAGLVVGAVMRGPPDHGGKEREFSFGPFSEAMRPQERRALRQQMLERAPALRDMRATMRDDLQAIVAALRAEPFDAAAFEQMMNAQQLRLAQQITMGGQALRDFLVGMSAEERLAFADRLEERLRKKDKGKD